jgi:hypothetical protein
VVPWPRICHHRRRRPTSSTWKWARPTGEQALAPSDCPAWPRSVDASHEPEACERRTTDDVFSARRAAIGGGINMVTVPAYVSSGVMEASWTAVACLVGAQGPAAIGFHDAGLR